MMGLFSLFAKPLGWVMYWVCQVVPNYFLALLVFTCAIRLVLFPLSINNQKSAAERARLAPRLERIQKKYAQDRQKMMEKQQKLYEKEGVKMTGGCLPMLLQMLVLFSVIAVIYKPLTYVQQIPEAQINSCVAVVTEGLDAEKDKATINRFAEKSYYREMNLLKEIPAHREAMVTRLSADHKMTVEEAGAVLDRMVETGEDFKFYGIDLLEQPNLNKPSWLWLVVLASGLSSLATSLLSMRYSQASMSEEQKKMSGCSTNMMMYMMPVMSLVFCFSVPAGVAVYWVFSNLLAMVQTVVLNALWSPAKARAEAEAAYEARRQKKREDRERLKAARLEEQAAWQAEERLAKARAKDDITQKKSATPTATPAELPVEKIDEIPVEPVSSEEDN